MLVMGTRVWNCNIDMDDETRPMEPELIHKKSLTDYYSEADVNHIINVLLKTAQRDSYENKDWNICRVA